MNELQVYRQLKFLVKSVVWPVSGQVVFAVESVIVTPAVEESALDRLRSPICLIRVGDAQVDQEHQEEPGLLSANMSMTLLVSNSGDALGQRSMTGGPRTATEESANRGILEVQVPLLAAVKLLNDLEGMRIQVMSRSKTGARLLDSAYQGAREFFMVSNCTEDAFYHPPFRVDSSQAGGTVTLTWAIPATRFDTLGVRVRRVSGSTPTTSPTGGTAVAVGAPLALTTTDAPGSGTFSYSVFMEYDDRADPPAFPATTATSFSDPDSTTIAVP